MYRLTFPADEVIGMLRWRSSDGLANETALAYGAVTVPLGRELTLIISSMSSGKPGDIHDEARRALQGGGSTGSLARGGGRITERGPLDLDFLLYLPGDSITTFQLEFPVVPQSFQAITHLAAGLRWLYLGWTGLDDAALASVAQLRNLVYLQTWGNRFTDHGVQQLVALQELQALYLEEKTLSYDAFNFASCLPNLARLGIKDVLLNSEELSNLKAELPGVDIG